MNAAGSTVIGQPEQQELPDEIPVVWAVVTFATHNGKIITTEDPALLSGRLKVQRPPTGDDLLGALAVSVSDLEAQKIRAEVIAGQRSEVMRMQQQAADEQMRASLKI